MGGHGWTQMADGEAGRLGIFASQTVREGEWDSEQTHLPKLLDALFLGYTECRVV
jgi:hypothetical protein